MEVGDHKRELWTSSRPGAGQQNSRHAADGEGIRKPRVQYIGVANLIRPRYMVKSQFVDLDPCRYGDEHCRYAEDDVNLGPGAHRKEMVDPDDEGKDGYACRGVDHRFVAKEPFPREGGDDLRKNTEGGQYDDIDLRVSPRPEQVDVHHHVAAQFVREKMHTQQAVQGEKKKGGGEDGKGKDHEYAGKECCPGEHRHLHESHPGGTHPDDGDQKVDACQCRSGPGDLKGPYPVIDPHVRAELFPGEGGVSRPSRLGEFAQPKDA